jgi:hypothetical protein
VRDQRQARTIADAIIDRLRELGGAEGDELAEEGRAILDAPAGVDWAALLGWNRRACEWIAAQAGPARAPRR